MTLRLTIDNSMCKIEGLSLEQNKELTKLMSYMLPAQSAYFSGDYRTRQRSLLGKRGDFPSGLLYIVQDYILKNKIATTVKDLRTDPRRAKTPLKSILSESAPTPYPEQLEACKACLNSPGQGIIVAPTGLGKSLIVALLIDAYQLKTLIIVPSLELKRQLTDSLTSYFGIDKVGQGKLILVQNVDALDINKEVAVDMVIVDEFHHSGAKTYRELNKKALKGVYYKFGLTATPFRSNEDERLLLESVLSHVVYRIEYSTAVDKGYIVPMEAYYIEVPESTCDSNNWRKVYLDLVVNNRPRTQLIADILGSLKQQSISTLCLVKEVNHGDILSALSTCHFAHGQNEDTGDLIKFFNANKITTLIGTTGVLGEGVDTKPAEYIIIAGLGKSKNAFMQQVGRGFRKFDSKTSCKIILFYDKSHKWTISHYKSQVKYLKEEYGVVPKKLVL